VTEIEKIVLTSALTVVGGLLIFVLQRFLLEPLNDQSKILGRITYAMFYYGREYGFPINPQTAPEESQKRYWDVADHIRGLAASLAETSQGIRFRWVWVCLRLTPRRKRVNEAIGLLTRMSNSFFALTPEQGREQMHQNCADADAVLCPFGKPA
jgi:hypothetical protein